MDSLDTRIVIIESKLISGSPEEGDYHVVLWGPSSASKPTTRVAAGWFFEPDTGYVYAFNKATSSWVFQLGLQAAE